MTESWYTFVRGLAGKGRKIQRYMVIWWGNHPMLRPRIPSSRCHLATRNCAPRSRPRDFIAKPRVDISFVARWVETRGNSCKRFICHLYNHLPLYSTRLNDSRLSVTLVSSIFARPTILDWCILNYFLQYISVRLRVSIVLPFNEQKLNNDQLYIFHNSNILNRDLCVNLFIILSKQRIM